MWYEVYIRSGVPLAYTSCIRHQLSWFQIQKESKFRCALVVPTYCRIYSRSTVHSLQKRRSTRKLFELRLDKPFIKCRWALSLIVDTNAPTTLGRDHDAPAASINRVLITSAELKPWQMSILLHHWPIYELKRCRL